MPNARSLVLALLLSGPASSIASAQCASWSEVGAGVDGIGVGSFLVVDEASGPVLYVGGKFDHAGGVPAANVARWNGTSWTALGSGFDKQVEALAMFDDGTGPRLYAGGLFGQSGTTPVARIARWNGTSWSGVASGVDGFAVTALQDFDDGNGPALFVAGSFASAGGVTACKNVARWSGTTWSGLAGGLDQFAAELAVYDDGNGTALYAGGAFSLAGGVPARRIARWDGATWSPLAGGLDSSTTFPGAVVGSLAVHDDGRGPGLYVGGFFETAFDAAGAINAFHVARWDQTGWSALGDGLDQGPVRDMVSFDDGSGPKLYVVGDFEHAGGVPLPHVAVWDETIWRPLGVGLVGAAAGLTVFQDGHDDAPDLYVGGWFTASGVTPLAHLARWHGCAGPGVPFCTGDGSFAAACPCGNTGLSGRGCDNSAATGGARLAASGTTSPDTLVLASSGELATALSIVLQGDGTLGTPAFFGDGLRCVGGALRRIASAPAVQGTLSYPGPGDRSISAVSASLGDPIAPGSTRWYQVYYRDPDLAFCPAPPGNSWNVSSGIAIVW